MPLFRTQSAAQLPSLAPHNSKAVAKRSRFAGIHGEAMYTAPDCAARAALQAANCQCRGSRGPPLAFSWGSKGDILSRERISPFPVQRQRRCLFPETFLSVSEKRFQLLCAVISEKRIKRRIHRAAAKVAVNAHMLDALVEADISCAVAGRGVVGCTQCFGGFQLVVRAIV